MDPRLLASGSDDCKGKEMKITWTDDCKVNDGHMG